MGKQQGHLSGLILLFGVLLLAAGCTGTKQDTPSIERLSFDVVDSLLADTITLESSALSIRAPAEFQAVSDSVFNAMEQYFRDEIGTEAQAHLERCLFSEDHQALMAMFAIDSTRVYPDPGEYIAVYTAAVETAYGKENVTYGEYMVNNAVVRNFMVTDSDLVRVHLLVLSTGHDAVEVQYIVPRHAYPVILKSLESSIGTLTLKTEEN